MPMDYKEELFRLLEQHLSVNEQKDIKEVCNLMEECMQTDKLNESYQAMHKLFQDSEYSYVEFKLQLGKNYLLLLYKKSILTRQSKQEQLENTLYFESYKLALPQIEKDFPELDQSKQNDLAFEIAEELYRLKVIQSTINESINIYEDRYNLTVVSDKKIDAITFKYNGEKREIKTQSVIELLQEEFYNYIQIRRFQYKSPKELLLILKELRNTKKHLVTFAIRQVANTLIKYGLITEVSKGGNSYRLLNKNGENLQLNNQIAIKIYNIIKAIGFETLFKGRKGDISDESPTDITEMKDYIKDRLKQEVILQINLKTLYDDYQKYIL